jgi:gliding motility-associated-like protein
LPAYAYTWQDNSNTTTYNATTSGQYILNVNNQGCIVNDTVNIVMSTTPAVNLGADQLFCDGTPSVNLNAGAIATATYSWQDGSIASNLVANQDGLYWVIVNNQGCIDRDSINLVFSNMPTVNLGPDALFCDGRLNTLLDVTSPSNKATYLWQDGSKNPTLLASQDQMYWVTVNDRGCKASDSVSYVFSSMPTPNLGPDIPTCIGVENMVLDATSGSIPSTTYLWHNGDEHPTFYANQTGTYSVIVDSKGCIAGDTVFLFLGAFPIVDLGPDRVICPDEEVKLSVLQSNVEATWEDGSSYLYHFVNQAGTYSVHVVSNTGCVKDDQITFSASGLENVDLGEDKTICNGDSVTLTINVPANATYTWSTGQSNMPISVAQAGEYSIRISTTDCNIADNIKVTYSDCQNCYVYVPSAFSPNGDNANDRFLLKSNCTIGSSYQFSIYDRMGRKVWESASVDDEWTGDVKGSPVPEGVYTYHLRCTLMDDGREKRVDQGGTITVIR